MSGVAASLLGSTGTTVLALIAVLVVVGVAMIVITVWLVRSTRSDPASLGPLEVMGDRGFRRASEDGRSSRLAAARPDGAPIPAPIVPLDDPPARLDRPGPAGPAGENGDPFAPPDDPSSGRDPSPGVIRPTPRDESRPDPDPAPLPDRADTGTGEPAG